MVSELSIEHELNRLHNLEWKEFEKEIFELVNSILKPAGFIVKQTSTTGDGGKDVDAHYALLQVPEQPFGLEIRIWAEAKHRSKSKNIGKALLSYNLAQAWENKVACLIVLSNVDIAKGSDIMLEQLAVRMGVQLELFVGKRLASLIVETRERCNEQSFYNFHRIDQSIASLKSYAPYYCYQSHHEKCVEVFGMFSPQLIGVDVDPLGGKIYANTDQFVCITILIRSGIDNIMDYFTPTLEHRTEVVIPAPYGYHLPFRLTTGGKTTFRWVFRADTPIRISVTDFDLVLHDDKHETNLKIQVSGSSSLNVSRRILVSDLPKPRQRLLKQLEERSKQWCSGDGNWRCLLRGTGGSGKTFLLERLQAYWATHHIMEICVDAQTIGTSRDFIRHVLSPVWPFESNCFDEDDVKALQMWLEGRILSPKRIQEIVKTIASAFLSKPLSGTGTDLHGDALAQILRLLANRDPILLTINDAHKLRPDCLQFLKYVLASLDRAGDTRIAIFLTSRHTPSLVEDKQSDIWSKIFEEIIRGFDYEIYEIPPLTTSDAEQLIYRSVPILPKRIISELVARVGHQPWHLRESLLWLESAGVIERDTEGHVFLGDLDSFYEANISGKLATATQARINAFLDQSHTDAATLLRRAALFDGDIPIDLLFPDDINVSGEKNKLLLEEAERIELIKYGFTPDHITLDHDLIRDAILETLTPLVLRHLIKPMSVQLDDHPTITSRQRAELAFLNGDLQKCMIIAWREGRRNLRRGRQLDSLGWFYLVALCLTNDDRVVVPYATLAPRLNCVSRAIVVLGKRISVKLVLSQRSRDRWNAMTLRYLLDASYPITGGGHQDELMALSEGLTLTACSISTLRTLQPAFYLDNSITYSRNNRHNEAEEILRSAISTLLNSPLHTHRRLLGKCLIHRAIALRHLGDQSASLNCLLEAHSLRLRHPWETMFRVRANIGSLDFYTDPTITARHWQRALALARRGVLAAWQAHILCDLAVLDITLDRANHAEEWLIEAREIAQSHDLAYQQIRINLAMSGVCVLQKQLDFAEVHLRNALADAARYAAVRQSWRILANLATIQEAADRLEEASRTYVQLFAKLNDQLPKELGDIPRREFFPILNTLMIKAENGLLADKICLEKYFSSSLLSDLDSLRIRGFNKAWRRHMKDFGNLRRFLVTE